MMAASCPTAAARDALLLLRSGRANMALAVLEGLPELIAAEIRVHRSGAYLAGRLAGESAMHARLRPALHPEPAPLNERPSWDRPSWVRPAPVMPRGRSQ